MRSAAEWAEILKMGVLSWQQHGLLTNRGMEGATHEAIQQAMNEAAADMRERAASLVGHPQCDFTEPAEAAAAIRALPIVESH